MSFIRRSGFRKQLGLVLSGALVNLTLTGCFPMQPVEGTPAPATDVRVHLTEPAAARISTTTVLPVTSVAGQVVRADGDSLVLLVRWGELATGARRVNPETVYLGSSDIDRIEAARFSLTQSIMFAVGGALVIAGLLSLAPGILDPRPDPDPPPPEPR